MHTVDWSTRVWRQRQPRRERDVGTEATGILNLPGLHRSLHEERGFARWCLVLVTGAASAQILSAPGADCGRKNTVERV